MAGMAGKAILVLGMHRSGTSSVTGMLECLGASLGSDPLPADEHNPRGYAEHRRVVEIHDRFLRARGLAWDSPRAPDGDDFASDAGREALDALVAVLRAEFTDAPLWALKDPRVCRLLPLWDEVFDALGIAPGMVLVLRHPAEIVSSLVRRDDMTASRAQLLYLDHLLRAEQGSRGRPRSLVHYPALFDDWRAVAKKLADDLGLVWPRDTLTAAADIDAFLSPDLRHHRAATDAVAGARDYPWTGAAAEALDALAAGEDSEATLDGLRADLEAAASLYTPELRAGESRIAEAEAAQRDARKEADRAQRVLGKVVRSPRLWLGAFLRARFGGREP